MVSELLTQGEYQAVLRSQELVVIHFFTKWSPPCRAFLTPFLRLEAEFRNRIAFFSVDIEIAPEIARAARVQGVPTFVLYKRGDSVNIVEGADEAELLKKLRELTFRPT